MPLKSRTDSSVPQSLQVDMDQNNKSSNLTKIQSAPGLLMQPQRLFQVLGVSIAGISLSTLYVVSQGWGGYIPKLLFTTLGAFIVSLWLLNQKRQYLAILLYVISLTVLSFSLIYVSQGIHDEVVTLLPAILLFACMFGSSRQFFALLASIVAFLGLIVLAQVNGWYAAQPVVTNLGSFINLSVIIMTSAFFAYVLANDLRKALRELNDSKTELLELNEQLEIRVSERTEQFENANIALEESLTKLEKAYNELIHAEKLASLGSMVAGISHELNTPIGNALLASTTMELQFKDFLEKTHSKKITRASIEEFLEEGIEISSTITRSNSRAANLITSFKQVAVDQTSEQLRHFDLREVISDNIATLNTIIKKSQIKIENTVPPGIVLDSFPGPFGQILSNLIHNSIVHGYSGRDPGSIQISAIEQENLVVVKIKDDGVGMAPSIVKRIFDPFFTTKLGQGGTGLGLSISHRIATSVLGGDLQGISPSEGGALFIITVPKSAPFSL